MSTVTRDLDTDRVASSDKYEKALALIDKIKALQFGLQSAKTLQADPEIIKKQINEIGECVKNLDRLQHSSRLSNYLTRLHQPNTIDELVTFISGEEFQIQFTDLKNLTDIKKEFAASKVDQPSSVDSHNIKQILKNQREAIDHITRINQLQQTLHAGVENTIYTNLKSVLPEHQIKSLLNHKATQATITAIIKQQSIQPHQNLDNLAFTITQDLLNSKDPRLNLLIKLTDQTAHGDILQTNLKKDIEHDPDASRAFNLVQGKDDNDYRKVLESATLLDRANNNEPHLITQLESILDQQNIHDPAALTLIETELLTHNDLNLQDTQKIIESHIGAKTFNALSTENQEAVTNAFYTTFWEMDNNKNIVAIRKDLVTNQIDAITLQQRIITTSGQFTPHSIISESYNPQFQSVHLSLDNQQFQLVRTVIQNPSLLSEPNTFNLIMGTNEPPAMLVQRWQSFYLPPNTTTGSPFVTFQTWASNTHVAFNHRWVSFTTNSKAFFEPLGKGITKLGSTSLGSTLKSIGSTVSTQLGTFVKTLPQLFQTLMGGIKTMGVMLSQAGAAIIASAEIWVPIVLICIPLVIFLFILIPNGGPMDIARTNIPGAGGAGDESNSNYTALICTPDEPDCPASMCKGCSWPVKCGAVTQCPGGKFSHKNLNAIDFGMADCSSSQMGVYTPVTGIVDSIVMAYKDGSGGVNSTAGYGNKITIKFQDAKTGRWFLLLFGHLSNQNINGMTNKITVGQVVHAGQLIAYADHTGFSTAAHLHFELRALDGGKVPSITTLVPNSSCK
jgi:hypothetical protein